MGGGGGSTIKGISQFTDDVSLFFAGKGYNSPKT